MPWDVVVYYQNGLVKNKIKPDVTAPPVPTGLASPEQTGSTISLQWNESVDAGGAENEIISGTATYSIYRDGAYLTTTTNLSVIDAWLTPARVYSYQILATDGAGNSSALSSAVNVATTAQQVVSYPTPDEVWEDAPAWPTEAQVLSASEWQMNAFNGEMVGKIVHMYPRDEGHADSKSFIDAYNELISGNASRGGILYVHYGTGGVHDAYRATDANPNWSQNGNFYLVGVPDAAGNRPTIQGHESGAFHPFLINGQLKCSDIFIKDIIFEEVGGSECIGFGRSPSSNSGAYDSTYVSRPTGQKLVLENVDIRNSPVWHIATTFEWTAAWFDDTLRDMATAEVSTEVWWRNIHLDRNHASHSFYVDRIKKAVILESKFESPGPFRHAMKVEAREFIAIHNEISNAGLDGTIYSSNVPWSSKQHFGAVPVSLLSGQYGYFCDNIIVHHMDGSSPASVQMQPRHNAHCHEVPDPMRGPTGPANTSGDFFDPTFWTQRATYLDFHMYDNTHVKISLNTTADNLIENPIWPLIAKSNGTWPCMTPLNDPQGFQMQCDNPYMQSNYGQAYSDFHVQESGLPLQTTNGDLYINVPNEWFERSRIPVDGDVMYGITQTGFNARVADTRAGYYESQAQSGVDENSVNPSDDVNISPRTSGTGPGRYVINSAPTFGGATYDYTPRPSWYPAVGEVVEIGDGSTLGESVRAQGGFGTDFTGVSDPDDIVDPWCGGALLTLYGRPYLVVYGGGHGDSRYNGIHKFGPLDAESPTWSVFLAPSDISDYLDAPTYADGRQSSNHTYNELVGIGGTLYNMNTSSRANAPGSHSPDVFKFTSEGATVVGQTQLADNIHPPAAVVGAAATYNGKIYWRGSNTSFDREFYIYDIASDSWSQFGDTSTYFENYIAMPVDTSRGAMLIVGKPNSIYYDDLSNLSKRTGLPVPPDFSPDTPVKEERCCAVQYDAGRDTFASLYLNNVIYELDAATLASGGTPSWTQRTFTGTSWGTPSPNGVYGRFQYIPSMNGYVIFPGPGPDGSVYFARST